MGDTRRNFLRAGTAAAAGLTTATAGFKQETTQVRVPAMRLGDVQIGRLVLGTNPFYGYSHINRNLDHAMRQFYTPEKICQVMRSATEYGINAFNYVNLGRSAEDLQRYYDSGGKMHLVAQLIGDPEPTYRAFKPLAMYCQGEVVDKAYQNGEMESVHDWCKKARQLGTIVGVGTHKPEVIEYVEERGWDVDFYAGCVYNRTRTPDEWRALLNGNLTEQPREIYLQSDPARMYGLMRRTSKPCFAFKVLAAGRIADADIEQAFRTAFSSMKPTDGVIVGMWPYRKDEIRENAEIVARVLGARST